MGIRKLLRASDRETSAHLPLAHGQICGIAGASKDTFLILLKLALFGDTVEPRFSVILAANFPLNSKFFSGYQKLILLSKITLNRGLPRFSVAF